MLNFKYKLLRLLGQNCAPGCRCDADGQSRMELTYMHVYVHAKIIL